MITYILDTPRLLEAMSHRTMNLTQPTVFSRQEGIERKSTKPTTERNGRLFFTITNLTVKEIWTGYGCSHCETLVSFAIILYTCVLCFKYCEPDQLSKVTGSGLGDWSSTPGTGRDFSLSHNGHSNSGIHATSYLICVGVNRPKREADSLRAEVDLYLQHGA